ncbi:uncharacterized protein LOC136079201 [Hydra vulgaris]|uniref:Uncharacterized protein LOC136079201 n=1 Tax=Hydra vulgaris TaxID=6087 RepID=A0ABM4BPE1_HYDVU
MTTSQSILNITETPIVDESIEKYYYRDYDPASRPNLNNTGNIIINIEQSDLYSVPSDAYLLFEGRLLKADNTAYANADAVALTNNGIMYLFSQIAYQLSNQDIEYKDSATAAVIAENTGFAARQGFLIQKPTAKGTFSFCVPLKHIFGFCDDYDTVIYGFKHTIVLTRKSDDDAIFRGATVAAGKVDLQRVTLFMPHVQPALAQQNELLSIIASKATIPVAFRTRQCDSLEIPQTLSTTWKLSVKTSSERPRYIIVGFQTNKNGDQTTNPALFDHCDLKNIYVMLSSDKYPVTDYSLSFPNQQFSRAYKDAAVFSEKYYGMNELITNSNIQPLDYKDLFPIFVIDVSNQPERYKSSVIDIQIKMNFNTAVPQYTIGYALVISDKLVNFKSDGDNGLIDKDAIMSKATELTDVKRPIGRPRLNKVKEVRERKPVGRPRLNKVKEEKEKKGN